MHSMGCRVLHHEEDARQEPELLLRFGSYYRTYLTLTPNYKHAGECMFVKNTHSAKLLHWMEECLEPREPNGSAVPITSDACIPAYLRRCVERLGHTHGLTERAPRLHATSHLALCLCLICCICLAALT